MVYAAGALVFLALLFSVPAAATPTVAPSSAGAAGKGPRFYDTRYRTQATALVRLLSRRIVTVHIETLPPKGFNTRFRSHARGVGAVLAGKPLMVLTTTRFVRKAVRIFIEYQFPIGKRHKAASRVVAQDSRLTLLAVADKRFGKFARPSQLRTRSLPRGGEYCYTLPAPADDPNRMTRGTVWPWSSGKGKQAPHAMPYDLADTIRYEMGVPLFDSYGRLIGINALNSRFHAGRCFGFSHKIVARFLRRLPLRPPARGRRGAGRGAPGAPHTSPGGLSRRPD